MTKLVKNQKKTFRTEWTENNGPHVLIAEIRYDDECGNGHNTFSVTGELYEPHRRPGDPKVKSSSGKTLWLGSCGCLHEEIARRFPELAKYIKWHLVSSDGPLHYIENARYHNRKHEIEWLKSTIVYGSVPSDSNFNIADIDDDDLRAFLRNRLSELMQVFQAAVEELGLIY